MHISIHLHMHMQMHMHTYTHTHIHAYTHTHIRTCAHMHIHPCTHTPIHPYTTHTCVGTFTRTYIRTCLPSYLPACLHTYLPAYLLTHLTTKLPGGVGLFRLVLSWPVQVLKSVASAALFEKGSVFWVLATLETTWSSTSFVRLSQDAGQASGKRIWRIISRLSIAPCPRKDVCCDQGLISELAVFFASDCSEACFASPHRMLLGNPIVTRLATMDARPIKCS